jgi:hypothetical protein
LGKIRFFFFMVWIGEQGVQLAIIGEQQQSFGIAV